MQQVLHSVAHLARQQFVGFLSLLALGDIKEDAEHDPIGYVRIVALAPSGNPPDVVSGQNTKINFVRAYDCARGRECRPHSFKISRMNILGQDLESDACVRSFETSQSSYARSSKRDGVGIDIPRP